MREAQRKTIGGSEWVVQPWPGLYGVKMQARWGRVAGPALRKASASLGKLATQGGGSLESLMAMAVEDLAPALGEALAAVLESTDDNTPQLIVDTLAGTVVDGKDISQKHHFDDHFTQNYGQLYQGLAFVLQVNFGDFIARAAGTGNRAAPDAGQNGGASGS